MPKTFLHYEQPANTTIIIIKGMDLLKANMKVQNRIEVYVFAFISFDQLVQLAIDLFYCNSQLMRFFPVLTDLDLLFSVSIGSIGQIVVIPLDQISR